MPKIALCLYACILLLYSCTATIKNDSPDRKDEVLDWKSGVARVPQRPPGNTNLIVANEADLAGYWVGMFEPDTDAGYVAAGEGFYWNYSNKINIIIERLEDGKVYGHSVVAGNDRPFTGSMTFKDDVYTFDLKEPGDDQYDGAFRFAVSRQDSLLNGTWHAFKKTRIPVRKYTLQKTLFRYDPQLQMDYGRYVDWEKKQKHVYSEAQDESDYDISYFTTTPELANYNASTQLLTAAQVGNMKKGDLFVLRNAIYARHGYSFKNRQLRVYFDNQPWYVPVSTDIKSELTDIEKKNIELLLRYEKNAKEYYDVFGRG